MKNTLKVLAILITALFVFFGIYVYPNYSTPILMYHSLNASKVGHYAAVEPSTFYEQIKFIKENGYKVIPLSEYCRLLREGEKPPRHTVVITFDDGYKDNLYAVEVLRQFGFPATIFLIPAKMGKEEYLSVKEVRNFLNNSKIRVGSHTLTHAYLPDTGTEQLKEEIHASKHKLQKLFKQEVETIAYPIGGFDRRVPKEVEAAGYLCACSTNRGFSKKLDRFALRRIKVTNRDHAIRLWAKLSGFYNVFKRAKNPH
jgi:peptidoglycan/xylan/chitin deacetylase (PgdA/CDA1 family)